MNQTAEWIRRTHAFSSDEYECSACEAKTDAPYEMCPTCGKKMEGEIYDPSWVKGKHRGLRQMIIALAQMSMSESTMTQRSAE